MHDVFYFTDIHGCYHLFQAVMDFCMKQDPECMIIFGGDACDRGKDGYRIMKELLNNPQVLYLKGNHEDMFVHAAWELEYNYKLPLDATHIWKFLYDVAYDEIPLAGVKHSLINGGLDTLFDWMMDGMPLHFVDKIQHLPLTFSIDKLDFCHAGGDYKIFKRVADDEYNVEIPDKDDMTHVLWDRVCLGLGWKTGRTCIFGHTPTPHLAAKYYGRDKSTKNVHPCAYIAALDDKRVGRKIDMDTGAFASGKLYVLNCLTMQAYGFKDTDFENKEIRNHDIEQFEVIQF